MRHTLKKWKNNTSGFRGVHWVKQIGKWQAEIIVNKQRYHLGTFDTPEEGYEAYKAKRIELFGENVPESSDLKETRKYWRMNNIEKNREIGRQWKKRNPEKCRAVDSRCGKERRKKIKLEIVKEYGGECICCGEKEINFLTIDHIRGDGAEHRRKESLGGGHKTYLWLKRNGYPKRNFRLLCYNCNCSRGFYGVCPHELKRMVRKVEQ